MKFTTPHTQYLLICISFIFCSQTLAQTRIDWSSGRADLQIQENGTWRSKTPVWMEAFHGIERMPEGWSMVQRSNEPGGATNPMDLRVDNPDHNPDVDFYPYNCNNEDLPRLFSQRTLGFIDAYIAPDGADPLNLAFHQVLTHPERYNSIARTNVPELNRLGSVNAAVTFNWRAELAPDEWTISPALVVYFNRPGIDSAGHATTVWTSQIRPLNLAEFGNSSEEITVMVDLPPLLDVHDPTNMFIQIRGFKGVSVIDELTVDVLNSENTLLSRYTDDFDTRKGMEELEKFASKTQADTVFVNVLVYMRDLIPLANDPRSPALGNGLYAGFAGFKKTFMLDALDAFMTTLPENYKVFLKINLDPDEAYLFPELHELSALVDDLGVNGDYDNDGIPGDFNAQVISRVINFERIPQDQINNPNANNRCEQVYPASQSPLTYRRGGGWMSNHLIASDTRHASTASQDYRNYIKNQLSQLVSVLNARTAYRDKVAGFMFGFSPTGENFIPGTMHWYVPDANPGIATAGATTFDNLGRHSPRIYRDYYLPLMNDPVLNSELTDATDRTREMADALSSLIKESAQIIRQRWTHSPIVLGTYYAYLGEFSEGWGRLMEDGHTGPLPFTNGVPDVDMILAPASYNQRGDRTGVGDEPSLDPFGFSGATMTLAQGLHSRRVWMVQEMDLRTDTTYRDFLAMPGQSCGLCPDSVLKTMAQFKREYALAYSIGAGAYYLDFGDQTNPWLQHHNGHFNTDKYYDLMGALYQAYPSVSETQMAEPISTAEVAFVADRESLSFGYFNNSSLHPELLGMQRTVVNQAGFKYDWLEMDDLLEMQNPAYKMIVFLHVAMMTAEERAAVNNLKNGNRHLVFVHGTDVITRNGNHGLSTAQMAAMISAGGVWPIEMISDGSQQSHVTFNNALPGLNGAVTGDDDENRNRPLFTLNASHNAVVIGTYNNGKPGAWHTDFNGWRSVFLGVANAPPCVQNNGACDAQALTAPARLWRELARNAGVQLHAEDNRIIHLGNNRLYAHIGVNETATVKLPGNIVLTPLVGNEPTPRLYTGSHTQFTLTADANEGASIYRMEVDGNPDLVVQNISITPNSPRVGDTVNVSALIVNQGDAPADATFVVHYSVNDNDFDSEVFTLTLQPGASRAVSSSYAALNSGLHTFRVRVEPIPNESNPDNNFDQANVYVSPAATTDLAVTQISVSPSSPVSGQSMTTTATIGNPGDTDVTAYSVHFYVNNQLRETQNIVQSLPSGSTRTLSIVVNAGPPGTEIHKACIALNGDQNPSNNCDEIPVNVVPGPLPDVTITDISWSPQNPVVGQAVTLHAIIRNVGNAATPTGIDVGTGFTINGAGIDSAFFVRDSVSNQPRALNVNESYSGTGHRTWVPTSNTTYTVCAIADDQGRFTELDDSLDSNRRCETLTVSLPVTQPDVFIMDLWTVPPNPVVGDVVTLHAVIHNMGTSDTPAGVDVGTGFTVNGAGIDSGFFVRDAQTNQARALEVNESYTGQGHRSWVPSQAEVYTVCAIADDVNRFPEIDETNNARCETVSVQVPLPDVIITDVTTIPSNPRVGDAVTLIATIKNQGNAPTPANIDVGVGFQVNGVTQGAFFVRDATTNQARSLAVNESYSGQSHLIWTPSNATSYSILAWADDVGRFTESNETNNKKYKTMIVSQ